MLTCAAVRAIHIEILADRTTLEVLLAFRQFVSKKEVPLMVISDNAPQFHQLNGCFLNIWKEVEKDPKVADYFAKHAIKWHFVVETAVWMGGMSEGMIGTVKRAFKQTFGDVIMLVHQFKTTMMEIEGIINSRPILYVDTDSDSPILAPSDFLAATFTAIIILHHSAM